MQRNAKDLFSLGNLSLQTKQYTEAISFFSQALEEGINVTDFDTRDKAEAYYKRGIAFFKLGMLDDAWQDFTLVHRQDYYQEIRLSVEYHYEHIRLARMLVKRYRQANDYQSVQAVKSWAEPSEKALSKFEPQRVEDILLYCKLSHADDAKKIQNLAFALKLDPSNVAIYKQRAKIYRYLKKIPEAIADYTCALDINPAYNKARLWRAKLYSDTNKNTAAIKDYTTLLKMSPTKIQMFEAFNNRGGLYQKQNKFDLAIADYTQALQLGINSPRLYFRRGKLYEQQKKVSEAIADYTQAIDLITKDTDENSIIGTLYSKRAELYKIDGKLGEAIFDYSRLHDIYGQRELADLMRFNSKQTVFTAIKNLPPEKKIPLLLDCLIRESVLGKKMWEQRWWTPIELGKGTLKEICDELDATASVISPEGYSYFHMAALGQDKKTFNVLHGSMFSRRGSDSVNNFKRLIDHLSPEALQNVVLKDPSVLDTVLQHHPAEMFHHLIEKLDDETLIFLLNRPTIPSSTIIKICEFMIGDPGHWRTAKIKSILGCGFSFIEQIKKIIAADPNNIAMHISLADAYSHSLDGHSQPFEAINSYMYALRLLISTASPSISVLAKNLDSFETGILNNLVCILHGQLIEAVTDENVLEEARIKILLSITTEAAASYTSHLNLLTAIEPINADNSDEAKLLKTYAQDMARLREHENNLKKNLEHLIQEIQANYYHIGYFSDENTASKKVAPVIVKEVTQKLVSFSSWHSSPYQTYKKCLKILENFKSSDEDDIAFKAKALEILNYRPKQITEQNVETSPISIPAIPAAKPEPEESLAEVMQQIRVLVNKEPIDREEKYLKLGTPDEVPMAEPESEPTLAELMRQIRVLVNKEPVASAIEDEQAKLDPIPAIQPERLKLDAKNMQLADNKVTNKSYRGDDLIAMAPSVPLEEPSVVSSEKPTTTVHRDRLFAGQEKPEKAEGKAKSAGNKSKIPLKPTT